jgi:hypothetical protein
VLDVLSVLSTTGFHVRSAKLPLNATALTSFASNLLFHADFSALVQYKLSHASSIFNVVRVTAHVCQFTLLTAHVGNLNSTQLDRVEYGSALRIYVLLSFVTTHISHCTACDRVVKSHRVATVYTFIAHTDGTILPSNFQFCQITGTFHGLVPASNADAVHSVGLFIRSL